MKYHAKLVYGESSHFWFNYEKDRIVDVLLVPFINGQVVMITHDKTNKLLNMKNVTLLSIYKTEKSLKALADKSITDQIDDNSFSEHICTKELVEEFKILKGSQSSSSLLQKSFKKAKQQVFIIMRFGDKLMDSAFEGVFKPVCESFGYKCIRIDEVQDSGKISDQILQTIAESKYIIADLTGNRPNCYYECGFAHALGKEMIFCAKSTSKVHFDLAGYRFIKWTTEADLRKQITSRLKSLEDKEGSSS